MKNERRASSIVVVVVVVVVVRVLEYAGSHEADWSRGFSVEVCNPATSDKSNKM